MIVFGCCKVEHVAASSVHFSKMNLRAEGSVYIGEFAYRGSY